MSVSLAILGKRVPHIRTIAEKGVILQKREALGTAVAGYFFRPTSGNFIESRCLGQLSAESAMLVNFCI